MRRTGIDIDDMVAVAGCVLLVYGLALWWVPAAWMGSGALLLGMALWRMSQRMKP